MEMFALDDDVVRLEAELQSLAGVVRIELLVELAWYLRQRDTRRAVILASEAELLLTKAVLKDAKRQNISARLRLVSGEAKWLFADLDAAEAMGHRALHEFNALGDRIGSADAHWLLAAIAGDRGDYSRRDAELEMTVSSANLVGDALRAAVAEAALARWAVLRDLRSAEDRWGGRLNAAMAQRHPALGTWINDYLGMVAFQHSDFGQAAACWMHAHHAARETGQVQRAINAATNVGSAFSNLNDHDTALEWTQIGLDLARPTGFPECIGNCLTQTAETLRELGRLDTAKEILNEGLETLGQLSGSRPYAIALQYLGELALDQCDYAAALDIFERLEERATVLKQYDFKIIASRGQAHALSHLDRPNEALAAAEAALAVTRAQNDAYNQIDAFKVLAEIHSRHALPAPSDMTAASVPLHYLDQALAVAATIDGYTVPGDLLDIVAREYANVGDHAQAYRMSLRANTAREKTHSQEATNRAIAMQVRDQTERARAEGEHHRQLAESEARRAEVLHQTSATLERLSAIGQEITTHLDAHNVFQTLDRHVHGLLDATHLSIFLIDADGKNLNLAFGVEAGKPLPDIRISLSSPTANSARCVRERREIMIDRSPDEEDPTITPGTLRTYSSLFAPLALGDRVIGVMTIQSLKRHAYTEREQLIFRTLCAYGAIALDNAAAYLRLESTLKTLSEAETQLRDMNIELKHAYQALEEVSLTDPLTGMRNRRFLLQQLDTDIALCLRRYDEWLKYPGSPAPAEADLVFFLLDIDHFKETNDTYGHAAGDQVLVQMRQRLQEALRESDYLVRWGGEEFLVVARNTNRSEAESIAERIREAVAGSVFELDDGLRLTKTCSIGFACFPFMPNYPRALTWSQIVKLADQGLYMAKNSGRNAWVGFFSNEENLPEAEVQQLVQSPQKAVQAGTLRMATSVGMTPAAKLENQAL